jgi:hypothetical protein
MKTCINKICKKTVIIALTAVMLANICAPAFAQTPPQDAKNAKEFLDKLSVKYSTDKHGQIVINGDLNLSRKQLTKLPDLSNVIVKGNFYAQNNHLTTLEGAPKKVGGDFDAHHNNLTTLEGAPQEVGRAFNVSYNKLTTLEGSPKEVVLYFFAISNNLTTLKGAPEEVGGDFDVSANNLTTLKGAPKKVSGYFSAMVNKLTTLEGLPEEVGGLVFVSGNNLGMSEEEALEIERNRIEEERVAKLKLEALKQKKQELQKALKDGFSEYFRSLTNIENKK